MAKRRKLQPYHAPRFTLDHRPSDPSVITIDMPGFRQTRSYSCGYAVTLMVVRHFGCERHGVDIFAALGTGRDGTRQTPIIRELRESNVRVNVKYDMTFDDYAKAVRSGRLVIVYLHKADHWSVVYGVGESPRRLFIADPRPKHRCEKKWKAIEPDLHGFGMICSHEDMRRPKAVAQESLLPAKFMKTKRRQRETSEQQPTRAGQPQLDLF